MGYSHPSTCSGVHDGLNIGVLQSYIRMSMPLCHSMWNPWCLTPQVFCCQFVLQNFARYVLTMTKSVCVCVCVYVRACVCACVCVCVCVCAALSCDLSVPSEWRSSKHLWMNCPKNYHTGYVLHSADMTACGDNNDCVVNAGLDSTSSHMSTLQCSEF